jgi:hypothetical protein
MSRTVTIRCSAGSTAVPVPTLRLGFGEWVALGWRGLLDRRAYLNVADTDSTHTLFRIERRHRRMESELVRRVDTLVSALLVRRAELETVIAAAIDPEPAAVPLGGLSSLRGRDRAQWADDRRIQTAAAGRRAAQLQRLADARRDLAALDAELRNLHAERDDVRLQWREAFMLRNARYTRSRFGLFGPRRPDQPGLAEYDPADALRGIPTP